MGTMSSLLPHIIIFLIAIAAFYLIMDIAIAMHDDAMPWWVKYVVAGLIFLALAGIEVFLGSQFP